MNLAQVVPLQAGMRRMTSEPNQVGSPHNKANAEATLALFLSWGWDAHIEVFLMQVNTPHGLQRV
jgi:N-acetylated-alpha-linked acidic dipeptidase